MSQVAPNKAASAPPPRPADQPPVRDIPVWLTLVILLLCVGGGGWLVWKYTNTNAPGPIVITPSNPRAALVKNWRPEDAGSASAAAMRTTRRPQQQDDDTDGIKPLTPNRSWRVRAGTAYMTFNIGKKGDAELTSANYRTFYTTEQNQLVIMRQRLLQDQAMRDMIKLTDEQLAKLKGVPPPEGMKMSDDEKKKLTGLFEAYRAAKDGKSQQAAEAAVVAALNEIGTRRFEETKAYMVKRVEAIQTAMTPDQIKQFHQGVR
jgi:hypothetical protein